MVIDELLKDLPQEVFGKVVRLEFRYTDGWLTPEH